MRLNLMVRVDPLLALASGAATGGRLSTLLLVLLGWQMIRMLRLHRRFRGQLSK